MNTVEHDVHPHAHAHAYVVEWRDGFGTGVAEVDHEHKHLFALVKALEVETADATIQELLEYVVTHFTNEQALMEASGYPDFKQHLELHEALATQVADFLASDSGWTEERVQNLRRFLNRWLVGHILTHDMRFGKWYQDHVRSRAATPSPTLAPRAKVGWFDRLLGRG